MTSCNGYVGKRAKVSRPDGVTAVRFFFGGSYGQARKR